MKFYPDVPLQKAQKGKYDHFVVCEDVQYNYGVIIPAGFRSNFASVPRFLWPIFPPHGRMALPSVVHDYLYDNRVFAENMGDKKARQRADWCFLRDMIEQEVPVWQAVTVYAFVRLFGKRWWDN